MVADLLTVPDVSARTGIPEDTVRWHCRMPQGVLFGRATKMYGRYLIPADAVNELVTYREGES